MYQTEELLAFDHALKNESNNVMCGPSLDVFVRTTQRCVGRRRQGFHYRCTSMLRLWKSTWEVHYPAHVESVRLLRPDLEPVSLAGWFQKNHDPGVWTLTYLKRYRFDDQFSATFSSWKSLCGVAFAVSKTGLLLLKVALYTRAHGRRAPDLDESNGGQSSYLLRRHCRVPRSFWCFSHGFSTWHSAHVYCRWVV